MDFTRRRWLLRLPLALSALVFAAVFVWLAPERDGERAERGFSAIALLSEPPPQGFERALAVQPFEFPADHGAHASFQTEWWYFTGHLADASGRPFGFQLTFFRRAASAAAPASTSAWATQQSFLAHFALSDVAAGRFHAFERSQRAALGLAGAESAPWRVWVETWSARSLGAGFLPLALSAEAGDVALELELSGDAAPVLNGEGGLSRKGRAEGNASYYYSMPRLAAAGSMRIGAQSFAVRGSAWLDREWGTSALEPAIAGWDWFAMQLDDGRSLMLYRLRREDGTLDPLSEGTLVLRDGSVRRLRSDDFTLEESARWKSPKTGASYPARWRIRVDSAGLDLDLESLLADQELALTFTYWEGAAAVRASGMRIGSAYVELVGYDSAGAGGRVESRSASRATR